MYPDAHQRVLPPQPRHGCNSLSACNLQLPSERTTVTMHATIMPQRAGSCARGVSAVALQRTDEGRPRSKSTLMRAPQIWSEGPGFAAVQGPSLDRWTNTGEGTSSSMRSVRRLAGNGGGVQLPSVRSCAG